MAKRYEYMIIGVHTGDDGDEWTEENEADFINEWTDDLNSGPVPTKVEDHETIYTENDTYHILRLTFKD